MRLIIDGTTGALAAAGGDSLAAGPGQADIDAPGVTLADIAALGAGGQDVWYDQAAGQLKARAHVATADETTRTLVLAAAGSAVGVNITALTAGQQRALLAILLYRAGALDASGVVQDLHLWAR